MTANPPGQLIFSFKPAKEKTFTSYHVTNNETVVRALCDIGDQLSHRSKQATQVYLWGMHATGKSHLLQALCCQVIECGGRSAYLPLFKCIDYGCDALAGLESFDLLCLDDMDDVLSRYDWQQALFHLINQVRANANMLVMAGRKNPTQISLQLKDLASRLIWGAVYHLQPLPDKDKASALCGIARQLQFELPHGSADYLLKHYSRDLSYLTGFLKFLSHAAQRNKCRLTIPFIKQVAGGFSEK